MHHAALRVADLERSRRFYEATFGAQIKFESSMSSEMAEYLFGTARGTSAGALGIFFDGGAIEVFAFDPGEPFEPVDQKAVGQMHFCLTVDDVAATAARAEAAGGRALFPVMEWGECHFVYLADPDGNIIELVDIDHATWIRNGNGETPPVPED
jgi:catechol 2,3-dioxygenase-like lactoylglutathione lyase family enzyme